MRYFQASAHAPTPSGRGGIFAACLVTVLACSALIAASTRLESISEGEPLGQTRAELFSGQWTAEFLRHKPGEIQFMFHRRSERGGMNMTGDAYQLGEFQGLSPDVASADRTNVSFSLVREAGTFQCEGYFREGKGAGHWTFAPNGNFVSAMRGRGYEGLGDEDLLRAALHNLTTKYVDDLKAVGYDRLEFRQLSRAATHDVTPQYIRELQAAGYQGLTMDELIRARNHEIDAAYIKEVRAMGFDKQPLQMLIRLRNHDITRAFIERMSAAGFNDLSIAQLIRLKNHDVTPEFISELKAEGFAALSPEVAVRLKNHNIDRDYIRRVKAKGFTDLSPEQLIRLRNHDIVK